MSEVTETEQLRKKLSSENVCIKHMKIDDKTLRRYLIAFHTVDDAYEKIIETDTWRGEYKVANVTSETPGVKKSMQSKVAAILDQRDYKKRPIVYIIARNHSIYNREVEDMSQYIVYILETSCNKCLEDGPDNLCLLFDLQGFHLSCMDYPVVKNLFTILKDYYPERVGVLLILNAPFIFSACWRIIRSWLDENAASKINFIKKEDLPTYLDPKVIPNEL